jgi:hypothetical protein
MSSYSRYPKDMDISYFVQKDTGEESEDII